MMTPKRQPMIKCGTCGRMNDPDRGSKNCWYCDTELPQSASSTVVPFEFPDTRQPVRTVTVDGEPWFVAADVCAVLGIGRTHDAVRGLDDDERGTDTIRTPGGPQQVTIVNEPGLYSLILRSRKPEARAFKRWVTHEVLPAIRRTGSYATAPAVPDMSTHAGRLQILQMAIAAEERAAAAEQRVAELEPDAARARQTLDAHGSVLVRTVAKRFGIKERALWAFLRSEKLLISGGSSHNEPYAQYVQSGHFEVKTRLVEIDPDRPAEARSTTYVTPKGEALIWRRLYEAGLVSSPTMPARQLDLIEGGV